MRETAARISQGSAFVPHEVPFHVPLLGSLHVYPNEAIFKAFDRVDCGPQNCRFLRWECRASELRVVVELLDCAQLSHLQEALPRGKPWRSHYVSLGSVAAIDAALQTDFLAAVEAAFPIDASIPFILKKLEYHVGDKPPDKAPPKEPAQHSKAPAKIKTVTASIASGEEPSSKHTLNPNAKPFTPDAKLTTRTKKRSQHKARRRAQHAQHVTWERTGPSAIDQLIRATGTGNTGGRAAQKTRVSAADRKKVISKARQRNV